MLTCCVQTFDFCLVAAAQIQRHDVARDLLVVSDGRGRIVHATNALANCIGTTVSKLQVRSSSASVCLFQLLRKYDMGHHI
jgi:hypothetical protein